MKYQDRHDIPVLLTKEEADLIQKGLSLLVQLGIWHGQDPETLRTNEKNRDIRTRDAASKLLSDFEALLYDFQEVEPW